MADRPQNLPTVPNEPTPDAPAEPIPTSASSNQQPRPGGPTPGEPGARPPLGPDGQRPVGPDGQPLGPDGQPLPEEPPLGPSALEVFLLSAWDWLQKYWVVVASAAVVVIAAFVTVRVMDDMQEAARRDAWEALSTAMKQPAIPDKLSALQAVANDYDVPEVQALAHVRLGDVLFTRHVTLASDRAPDDLEQAGRAYQFVLGSFPEQTLAVGGAHFGLGLVSETKGDWQLARQHYQAIINNPALAGTPVQRLAGQRNSQIDGMATLVPFAVPATRPAASTDDVQSIDFQQLMRSIPSDPNAPFTLP